MRTDLKRFSKRKMSTLLTSKCLFLALAWLNPNIGYAANSDALLCAKLLTGETERPAPLRRGLDPDSHNDLLAKRIEFQVKAKAKNPNIRVLDLVELDQLKREKVVIGFVGFSGGSAFNERASRIAVTNFLRELDPTKVILSTGATNEGLPALVYEIGHKMGFKTMGITSLKSGNYDPARMDYLLVEGNNWGRESDYFISTSDVIAGFGGGKQSETEMIEARVSGKPVVPVANSEIQGATANIPGQKYTKGESAGRRVKRIIEDFEFFKWVRKLPENVNYITAEDLRDIFPDKNLIAFTGWALNGPKRNRDAQVEKFLKDFLSEMNPETDVVVTGGTHLGAERIVHDIAAEMGFLQISLVSHEIADPGNPLNPFTYGIVPVARTWEGRNFGLINNVDALISFGGGQVITSQFRLGIERGIPVAHMTGNFTNSDQVISDSSVKFRSGSKAGQLVSKGLP